MIYATIEGQNGDFVPTPYTGILGIFESQDQGVTWTFQSAPRRPAMPMLYTNTIAVDPGSPGDGVNDIVYWGGTDTFRSANSGVNFTDITNGIHADSHSWGFAPGTPTVVYAGNDGGIWRTKDSGATWTGTGAGPATINAGGLQTGLLYHMDIKRNATADVTLGAFQDNGDNKWTGPIRWINHLGGDGLDVIFDQQTVADAYAIDNGGPNISTDSGTSWSDITNNIPHTVTGTDFPKHDQSRSQQRRVPILRRRGESAKSGSGHVPGQLFQSKNFGGHLGADNHFLGSDKCRTFCDRACQFQQLGHHRRQLALDHAQRPRRDSRFLSDTRHARFGDYPAGVRSKRPDSPLFRDLGIFRIPRRPRFQSEILGAWPAR